MCNPFQKNKTKQKPHLILELTLFSWTSYLLGWDVQNSLLATLFLCCHRDRVLSVGLAPLCYYLHSLLPLLLWTKHGPGGLLLMDLLMYTIFDVPHKDCSFYKTGWPLTIRGLVFFLFLCYLICVPAELSCSFLNIFFTSFMWLLPYLVIVIGIWSGSYHSVFLKEISRRRWWTILMCAAIFTF